MTLLCLASNLRENYPVRSSHCATSNAKNNRLVNPAQSKSHIRRQMLQMRRAKSAQFQESIQAALQQHLLPLLPPPNLALSGYFAFEDEVNPIPMMHRLHALGYTMCLPVVVAPKTPLLFRQWTPDAPLLEGVYNIPEPLPSAPEVIPDVVLTPLLAFDRRGHRIGFGGGFYDRTLAHLRQHKKILSIGLAFSFQEIPLVPIEPTDEPLDWILTEKELLPKAN